MDIRQTLEITGRDETARASLEFADISWLGSFADKSVAFGYQILDLSPRCIGIQFGGNGGVPAGLAPGVELHLHLPFRTGGKFHELGRIVRVDERQDAVYCEVALAGKSPLRYPVFLELPFEGGPVTLRLEDELRRKLFRRVLKDAYFLKRGIIIYLDHLVPLFARAAKVRKRLSADDARRHSAEVRSALEASIAVLDQYQARAHREDFRVRDTGSGWDWDELRGAVLIDVKIAELAEQYRTREVRPYLRSILLLDHRLYTNFNAMVALRHLATAES